MKLQETRSHRFIALNKWRGRQSNHTTCMRIGTEASPRSAASRRELVASQWTVILAMNPAHVVMRLVEGLHSPRTYSDLWFEGSHSSFLFSRLIGAGHLGGAYPLVLTSGIKFSRSIFPSPRAEKVPFEESVPDDNANIERRIRIALPFLPHLSTSAFPPLLSRFALQNTSSECTPPSAGMAP